MKMLNLFAMQSMRGSIVPNYRGMAGDESTEGEAELAQCHAADTEAKDPNFVPVDAKDPDFTPAASPTDEDASMQLSSEASPDSDPSSDCKRMRSSTSRAERSARARAGIRKTSRKGNLLASMQQQKQLKQQHQSAPAALDVSDSQGDPQWMRAVEDVDEEDVMPKASVLHAKTVQMREAATSPAPRRKAQSETLAIAPEWTRMCATSCTKGTFAFVKDLTVNCSRSRTCLRYGYLLQ
jgi:hypothetical protein